MDEKSPDSRFSRNSPNFRQPLYLQPNSPYMSPRGNSMSSPNHNSGSPDFIPLGISSPRPRHSWPRKNYINYSNNSSFSTPPSPNNSSHNFSPYNRHNFRGGYRGRGSFNNSGSSSVPISKYYLKEMVEDPWKELEDKLKDNEFIGKLSRGQLQASVESPELNKEDSDSDRSDES